MRLTRANAAKWHLKPNVVGMMRFSTGGHLAAMAQMLAPPDARPDLLLFGYPPFPPPCR
jgi:acetyl esterase/lipase